MSAVAATSSAVEPPPTSSYELLDPKTAAEFYEEVCRREGLYIHSTFLKQLLLGSALIQFEDGYLGGSGIAPIVQTLQRVPLRALLLSRCALNSEDVKLLCAGLATHPQLEKIDVRGVDLTIGALKELLHLAARNPRITEILMDEGLPKYAAIQKQCQRNAQAATGKMSACVVCSSGVPVVARASCETLVLRFVLEHLKPHTYSISAASLTVLCGALQLCMERNDGILSVCSEPCGETLAEDLCRCVWSVTKTLMWKVPFESPKLPFLRVFLSRQLKKFQQAWDALDPAFASSYSSTLFYKPGPVDAEAEENWRTRKPRSSIDGFFGNRAERDVTPCTICGQPGVCSTDGATWLLRTLQIDVEEHGVAITPAALLRLCTMFTAHARVLPCSRRCLRHLVRYALYGYGGVNCSYVCGFPLLTRALGDATELLRLPLVDFTVVDVAAEVIDDVGSEEINCALTVASAVSDTDGVAMDPYLIFSIGRHLRRMSVRSIGMDLASACEAVRLVGCLPEGDAPYKRTTRSDEGDGGGEVQQGDWLSTADLSETVAPRDVVADWSAWSAVSGQARVTRWLHTAFAHRRQRVCAVDGPHHNLFDNIRAALWALRQQSRVVLVTVKVSMLWLSLKDGVVPATSSAHTHGFCTTAKVIGQTTRANTVLLILQCPLGKHVGCGGLLYMPKSVFLQCVRGLAFVFSDAVSMEYRAAGWRASFYAQDLVGPALGVANGEVRRLRQLFIFLHYYTQGRRHVEDAAQRLVGGRVPVVELHKIFDQEHLPPALSFLRETFDLSSLGNAGFAASAVVARANVGGSDGAYAARHGYHTYWERVFLSSRYPSQLLFYFSEMLGSGGWLQQAVAAAAALNAMPAAKRAVSISSTLTAITPADVLPPPSGAAPRAIDADGRHGADGGLVWQTLGSVPELDDLSYGFVVTPDAATTTAESTTTTITTKGGKKKGNAHSGTTTGTASAAAHAPKPPVSQPPPSSSLSRHRVSSAPSASSALQQTVEKADVKLALGSSGGGGNTATLNVASDSSTGAGSAAHDKLQTRLQAGWKAERTTRSALLHGASRVGVVEYLRTRTQASRVGPPPSAPRPNHLDEPAALTGRRNSKSHDGRFTSSTFAAQQAVDNDVPLHLLGKPWLVVPVHLNDHDDTDAATPPDLHLLFIGNSVGVYSMYESRLLCRPCLMKADAVMSTFPFASGVDAATLHPTNTDLVFFFSGREWLLFDLKLLECVDGPYQLSVHGQFRKLPAAFHDGVDSVIAVPESSRLVLFRCYSYVVFDVLTRRCVGGVGQLDPPPSRFSPSAVARDGPHAGGAARGTNAPTHASASVFSQSGNNEAPLFAGSGQAEPLEALPLPAADTWHCGAGACAGRKRELDVESGADTATDGAASSPSCPLLIAPELQQVLGTAPVSGFKTRGGGVAVAASSTVSHWLVSRRGDVVEVEWTQPALNDNCQSGSSPKWVLRCRDVHGPVRSPQPFSELPLVFRQNSPYALPALCELALKTNFALADVIPDTAGRAGRRGSPSATLPSSRLELFDPEQGQHELLSSTLVGLAVGNGDGGDHSRRASLSSTMHSSSFAPSQRATSDQETAGCADPCPTTIMSSLAATAVARRVPLALSRTGPIVSCERQNENTAAVSRGSGWGQEVLFYGDSAAVGSESSLPHPHHQHHLPHHLPHNVDTAGKTTHPRHFIEYDLGFSAPRRTFSALLLVLDTSLLPSTVLQLAPLTASIECSVEGEVYLPQAVLRVTGPVSAAKWGWGVLTVEPSAARFWRLRFCTPLPSVVGVVRLFWFETPRGLPRQAVPSVPLSLCVDLPLTVRNSDDASLNEESKGRSSSGGSAVGDVPPISIEAEAVVASPTLLLSRENLLPVVVDNPSAQSHGWYGHHAAFPLLTPHTNTTCLMFCGASFMEVHVQGEDNHHMLDGREGVEGGGGDRANGLSPLASPQCLAEHPGFAALPYPFILGWDTTFYPSPREEPGLLCLLRGEVLLLWNMTEGAARGDVVAWRHSALLGGLTAATPVARIVATVNYWSRGADNSVVAIFYESSSVSAAREDLQYLEFDLEHKRVVYGPVGLAAHLRARYDASLPTPPSENSVLLTVLGSPHTPSTLYVFYENTVQTLTVKSPGEARVSSSAGRPCSPIPLCESPQFFAVPVLLSKWGTRQHHCHITLDLGSLLSQRPPTPNGSRCIDGNDDDDNEGALVSGMQMISSGGLSGSATSWQVQCSDRGRVWEDVAVHYQKAGERVIGETMWVPRAGGRFSNARFWRFTRVFATENGSLCQGSAASTSSSRGSSNNSDVCLQSYSQLRLLGIPRKRCVQVPVRVTGTDVGVCTSAACSAFFARGTRASKVTLRRQGGSEAASFSVSPSLSAGAAYELVWDYGLSLIVVTGISFTVEESTSNVQLTWTVFGSGAAGIEHWDPVATASLTGDATRCCLSWVPNGPYRYWRLVCTPTYVTAHDCDEQIQHDVSLASLTLSAFRVYEYDGPLVSLQSATGVHLNATSLLWPSARAAAATAPSNMASSVDSNVVFSRVTEALTCCTIDYLTSGDCTARMAMEWSTNATDWHTVALGTFTAGDAVAKKVQQTVLSWQSCGPRRLWRIRVLDTTSIMTFLPVRVYLGTSPAGHQTKLSSLELLLDATAPVQQASAAIAAAPSRRGSVQVLTERRLSLGPSAAASTSEAAAVNESMKALSPSPAFLAGAGGMVASSAAAAAATADLCLESPQRVIGVRAALPSVSSRYAVEYLGVDGVSWLTAAMLESCADTQKERERTVTNSCGWSAHTTTISTTGPASMSVPAAATATAATSTGSVVSQDPIVTSVWWDRGSVSPSTHWRLRPLSKLVDAPVTATQQQQQQQKTWLVEWFGDVGAITTTVDTSEMPGVMVSTTGFTEVQPPHCLSGTDRVALAAGRPGLSATPVLQCIVPSTQNNDAMSSGPAATYTATWSFITPLLLDQLTLHLSATAKAVQQGSDDGDNEGATTTESAATCDVLAGAAALSDLKSEAAVQSVWVETSDNGEDYVAVAHSLWWPLDTVVTLTWEEVPPAAFWRLRLSSVAAGTGNTQFSQQQRQLTQYVLDIFAARWGVRRSSPALTAYHYGTLPGNFTITAYRAWLADCFNNEDSFMRDCQEAFNVVRSTESKLRTAETMSAPAMLAAAVQKMRTKYQVFMQKSAKEAARQAHARSKDGIVTTPEVTFHSDDTCSSAQPSTPSMLHRTHARWLSPPEYASSDVMLLLLESAASPLLGGEKLLQLAELVNHPVAFREAFKFTKKSTRWFYPHLEVVGQVAQDFYGFSSDNICASFSVYWSLSSALQRRKDVVLKSSDIILPLSEHVASPLVVVHITEVSWSPHQHFPGLPFLYATNFHDRPTTVVFALNDVVFTPPYALGVPSAKDSQALTSPYPYTLYAGVNFVQARTLDSCPAPVLDVLRFFLPPSLFRLTSGDTISGKPSVRRRTTNANKGMGTNGTRNGTGGSSDRLVLMVLTTSALQQNSGSAAEGATAQLHFTVSAEGVDFGLRGLVIDALEFEITMKVDGPAWRWTYQTAFVTHGARFAARGAERDGVSTEVPVSLLGNVEMHGLPVVELRGSLGNARLTAVEDLPGAVVSNVVFHGIAQIEKVLTSTTGPGDAEENGGDGVVTTPPPWICFPLQAEAQVTLPGLLTSYGCSCIVNTCSKRDGALAVEQLKVTLHRSSLSDVQAFAHACCGGAGGRRHIATPAALPSQLFDLCGVHVQMAMSLRVSATDFSSSCVSTQHKQGDNGGGSRAATTSTLRGSGLLYLDNHVFQGAAVEVNCATETVTAMATCAHPLHFGPLVVQGSEANPVSLQLLLRATPLEPQRPSKCNGGGHRPNHSVSTKAEGTAGRDAKAPYALHQLLIAGTSCVFGTEQAARVSLELTRSTDGGHVATLVAHSLRHPQLQAVLQDSAVAFTWRYAQVTVDEAALREALARELATVPIVASLRARGIPLMCVVSSVTAAPFDLVTQRLGLRVRGLLFGASFDVVTSVVCPDDLDDVWAMMAARLCPEVVEQCEENLWASYANVAGCRLPSPANATTDEEKD
jgi:hypothetical protein